MTDASAPKPPTTLDAAISYMKEGGSSDVAVTALLLAHGIPMAPSIVKRFRIGIGRLVDGGFDLIAGSVERASARRKFDAEVRADVVRAVAKAGAKELATSFPETSTAVALSMLRDYGFKLDNRAAVAHEALKSLASQPLTHDESPDEQISADWLNYFSDTAAQKTDPEMQRLMGQILAGEIRKPGSYSPLTVSVLATLTTRVARKFEELCRVAVRLGGSLVVPTALYPDFYSKGIAEVGLTYLDLLTLRANQFLLPETGASNYNVNSGDSVMMAYFDRQFSVTSMAPTSQVISVSVFSQVGYEMRSLILPQPLPGFAEKVLHAFPPPAWKVIDIGEDRRA